MKTELVSALLIPWMFWGIPMGLLLLSGRSWINLLLFPAGTTIVLAAIAALDSVNNAFWASLLLHLGLLVIFAISYIRFVRQQRSKESTD